MQVSDVLYLITKLFPVMPTKKSLTAAYCIFHSFLNLFFKGFFFSPRPKKLFKGFVFFFKVIITLHAKKVALTYQLKTVFIDASCSHTQQTYISCLTVADVNPATDPRKTMTSLKCISPFTVQPLNWGWYSVKFTGRWPGVSCLVPLVFSLSG